MLHTNSVILGIQGDRMSEFGAHVRRQWPNWLAAAADLTLLNIFMLSEQQSQQNAVIEVLHLINKDLHVYEQ